MKLEDMTDQQLIELAISTHKATQTPDWTLLHSARLSLLADELKRRGYEPRIHETLSFVRTRTTRGGQKP